jgi:type IV pilus assembly protein PilA
MLARLRKAKGENEGGFTLIELLVVVIIIGILAAIAIPTFLNQREKAWQKTAQSDLRNAAVAAEEFFSDNGTYSALSTVSMNNSDDVVLSVHTATATGYCLQADHSSLGAANSIDFHFDSADGKPAAAGC